MVVDLGRERCQNRPFLRGRGGGGGTEKKRKKKIQRQLGGGGGEGDQLLGRGKGGWGEGVKSDGRKCPFYVLRLLYPFFMFLFFPFFLFF